MKTKIYVYLLFCFLPFMAFAQNDHFSAGKMLPAAHVDISALGFGYGASFEFGITNTIGVKPDITFHNYTIGTQDWSFIVIDAWGTWHTKPVTAIFDPKKVDSYIMAGVTWASFGVTSGNASEETASSIGFGGGYGTRYYFSDKLSGMVEAKYRLATFKTNSYNLAIGWYTISAGISYAIN